MPRMTPWFDGDTKPARPGVYERRTPSGEEGYFSRWDGSRWMSPSHCVERAATRETASIFQVRDWRGLAEPAGREGA